MMLSRAFLFPLRNLRTTTTSPLRETKTLPLLRPPKSLPLLRSPFTSTSRSSYSSPFGPNNPRRPHHSRYRRPNSSNNRYSGAQWLALWRQSPLFRGTIQIALLSSGTFFVFNLERVPGSQRWRFNCISPSTERASGAQGYSQLLHEYAGRILPASHPESRMARRVVQRLLPHSGLSPEELEGWEVHVIDDPTANAFVIPGGKVFCFRGMLPVCGDEEGLAAVLSHEIAHNVCHHVAEGMSRRALLIPLVLLLEVFFQVPGSLSMSAANLAVELPGSRAQESEADRIGLMMMSKACYDPEAAVRLWERMKVHEEEQGGHAPLAVLSTHPTNDRRIRDIEGWLPKAVTTRSESGCQETEVWNTGFRKTWPQRLVASAGGGEPVW